MTNKKNIIDKALDSELNDKELQEFDSNSKLNRELQMASKADSLAKELFIPGYSELILDKKKELLIGLEESDQSKANTEKKNPTKYGIIIKLMGIAAVFLLVALLFTIDYTPPIAQQAIAQELKTLSLNSFDNSGLLHSSRSSDSDQSKQFLYDFYQKQLIIPDDRCLQTQELCNLTNAVIHIKTNNYKEAIKNLNKIEGHTEIKNKLLLFCHYSLDDDKYLENLDVITENKFPNYEQIESLTNKLSFNN